MGPNQRNEKIFSEGGHRKINPKVRVHIINHIISGKGVYKDTIVGVYKDVYKIQFRLNDATVLRGYRAQFGIFEKFVSGAIKPTYKISKILFF